MKNMLLITYFFPPLNHIAARRFGEIVEHMTSFGWMPWILTTHSSGSASVNISESNIIRISKHQSSHVEFNVPKPISKYRKIPKRFRISLRSLETSMFDWYFPLKKQELMILNQLPKLHCIISSYGPAAPHWIARYFSVKYNIPWIADFRDPGALRNRTNYISATIDQKIEKYLLKPSQAITTVSETWARMHENTYDKLAKVIYHGWSEHYTEEKFVKFDIPNVFRKPYVYYAGFLYEHCLKPIFLLLEALRCHGNIRLLMRSTGTHKIKEKILNYSRENGIEDLVCILTPCSSDQVNMESQRSVANIVLEDLNCTDDLKAGSICGKLTKLLPMKPPILAIAGSNSEIGKIVASTDKGKLCSSLEEIKLFFKDIGSFSSASIKENQKIQRFSTKEQANELCSFLNELVS